MTTSTPAPERRRTPYSARSPHPRHVRNPKRYSVKGRRLDKEGRVIIPELARFYVFYFPEVGVLKVGRMWRERRMIDHLKRGGQRRIMIDGAPASWEAGALAWLHERFEPAFTSKAEAAAVIERGVGYQECFLVPEHLVETVIDHLFHDPEGIRRYGHGPTPAALARRADERHHERAVDDGATLVADPVLSADRGAATPERAAAPAHPVRRVRSRRDEKRRGARRAHARGPRPDRHQRGPGRPRTIPAWATPARVAPCPPRAVHGLVAGFWCPLDSVAKLIHRNGRERERERERTRERASRAASASSRSRSAADTVLSGAYADGVGWGAVRGVRRPHSRHELLGSEPDSRRRVGRRAAPAVTDTALVATRPTRTACTRAAAPVRTPAPLPPLGRARPWPRS